MAHLLVISVDKLKRTASRVQIVQEVLQGTRAEIISHVDRIYDSARR